MICKYCNKEFINNFKRSDQKYCNKECKNKQHTKNKKNKRSNNDKTNC